MDSKLFEWTLAFWVWKRGMTTVLYRVDWLTRRARCVIVFKNKKRRIDAFLKHNMAKTIFRANLIQIRNISAHHTQHLYRWLFGAITAQSADHWCQIYCSLLVFHFLSSRIFHCAYVHFFYCISIVVFVRFWTLYFQYICINNRVNILHTGCAVSLKYHDLVLH